MRVRSSLVFAFALLAAWAIALAPRAAYAQTTTTSSGPSVGGILTVYRQEPDGTSADNSNENPHPSGLLINDISFEDCYANLKYEFDLSITSLATSGYLLNVWAGTQDCSQLQNRQAATAVCWEVYPPIEPNSNPYTTDVWMRDIVSQAFETTHTVTYAGEAPADVCQLQTTTGETAVSLYFFFTDGSGNPYNNEQAYSINIDMRAGDVQGSISVGVGQDLLIVNIPPTTDPDTQGWNVYCDPPPGHESAVETVPVDAPTNNGQCPAQIPDTGVIASVDSSSDDADDDAALTSTVDSAVPVVLDDAGGNACGVPLNEAGIPSPGGCTTSSVLVPGGGSNLVSTVNEAGESVLEEGGASIDNEAGVAITGGNMTLPPPGLCGTGSAASSQVNVLGLKDGVYYNLAVGAVDAFGNVGPLSNVVCGEPVPVNDFWKLYYLAGGRAGGGFCSAEGVGTPAGTSGLGALMLASMVAIVRRRRRK